jgi:hypothetical protein
MLLTGCVNRDYDCGVTDKFIHFLFNQPSPPVRTIPATRLTTKPMACALPCALGLERAAAQRTYGRQDWSMNTSAISKQLAHASTFEIPFSPEGSSE